MGPVVRAVHDARADSEDRDLARIGCERAERLCGRGPIGVRVEDRPEPGERRIDLGDPDLHASPTVTVAGYRDRDRHAVVDTALDEATRIEGDPGCTRRDADHTERFGVRERECADAA